MATFLQVTARGAFSSGAWSGEVAQCGWAFPIVDYNPTTQCLVNADIEEPTYDDTVASGTWAHGTYLQGFGGTDIPQASQEAVATAVYGWLQDIKPFQCNVFRWTHIVQQLIQFHEVPTEGWSQKFETTTYALSPTVVGTASSSTLLPPQCAAVISHYTPSTGSRNRGRVYVPMHKALSTVQLLASGDITALAVAEADFFDDIAAIVLPGSLHLAPAVVSRKYVSYSGVAEIRVGDEVDTQRRRKNARAETYTVTEWP